MLSKAVVLMLLAATPTMTGSVIGKVPATDQRIVMYEKIGTPNNVAFITIDDGYSGNAAAASYVSMNAIPITMFLTYYAVNTHAADFTAFGPTAKIGSHSKNHVHLPNETDDEQGRQLLLGRQWLQTLFSAHVPLFRPPYGEYNNVTRNKAYIAGHRVGILWTHSVTDGVITGDAVGKGSIFLMHFDADLLDNLLIAIGAINAAGLTVAPLENYIP
jgi:peptidoglycan/xylan/chitin deacetylase (PgdA/CDA1 family)